MRTLASFTLVSALVVMAFACGALVGSKPQWENRVGMESDMRALKRDNETCRASLDIASAIIRRGNETFRLMGAR